MRSPCPWGRPRAQTNLSTTANRKLFTGQEYDSETQLYYYKSRFYDPDTGRFLSQDSYLGEPGVPASLHRYLYVMGNPGRYRDPTGHFVSCEGVDCILDTSETPSLNVREGEWAQVAQKQQELRELESLQVRTADVHARFVAEAKARVTREDKSARQDIREEYVSEENGRTNARLDMMSSMLKMGIHPLDPNPWGAADEIDRKVDSLRPGPEPNAALQEHSERMRSAFHGFWLAVQAGVGFGPRPASLMRGADAAAEVGAVADGVVVAEDLVTAQRRALQARAGHGAAEFEERARRILAGRQLDPRGQPIIAQGNGYISEIRLGRTNGPGLSGAIDPEISAQIDAAFESGVANSGTHVRFAERTGPIDIEQRVNASGKIWFHDNVRIPGGGPNGGLLELRTHAPNPGAPAGAHSRALYTTQINEGPLYLLTSPDQVGGSSKRWIGLASPTTDAERAAVHYAAGR